MVVPQVHIRIVKSYVLIWMSTSHVGVCFVCLNVNGMLYAWYDDLFASLPFYLLVCYVWTLPLRWSSTLLMWADVRTPGNGDGNRDAIAWRIGQVLGLLWGPFPADSIIYVFLYEQDLVLLIVLFSIYFRLGHVEPFSCNLVLSDYSCMWCFINWGYSVFGTL